MADPVLSAVNRSNQRGGRVLSVIDLIDAGTLTRLQCAWILDRSQNGSSWLVGASPGGAGKTTIMSALLAMVPPPAAVHITNPGTNWKRARPGDCVVCYEVSRGAGYDGYIYGADVRDLCVLGQSGCRIVSNLHADTLDEARQQVVKECGATEGEFQAFGLFIPVRLSGTSYAAARVVERMAYTEAGAWKWLEGEPVPTERLRRTVEFLASLQRSEVRTVEAVRERWLAAVGRD